MPIELLRSLIWTDYRLALVFAVLLPIGLLVWSIMQRAKPITHLLVIYWRVMILLIIALYLMIAQSPFSFIVRSGALSLMAISLWFWVDLNEEIEDRRGELKLAFTTWRWAMTLYCSLAALGQVYFWQCLSSKAIATKLCQVGLEPPFGFRELVHANTNVSRLGFLAVTALVVYVLYLVYFLIFRLTKQGRSATGT